MKYHIYLVTHGDKEYLVSSTNRISARNEVAKDVMSSVLATQYDIARLVAAGTPIRQTGNAPENQQQLPIEI